MNIFQRFFAYLRLHEAVRKADKAHRKTRARYYVIPSAGAKRKLIIMDRTNFRKLKLKHYMDNRAYIQDLTLGCFYHTPYPDGTGALTESTRRQKVRQYFTWYETCLIREKQVTNSDKKKS